MENDEEKDGDGHDEDPAQHGAAEAHVAIGAAPPHSAGPTAFGGGRIVFAILGGIIRKVVAIFRHHEPRAKMRPCTP